ncbi:hypothetical protein DOTSEDRAFT_75572 [Dothistroma septosporum NZE10]|uniref:Uncharacterized protein n=1 Tax=Dothistroma septosporum (strain NZE10 / CBS 128990) TaxID=675120 RepID=M2WIV9_DOTSN|nr:hypothetical protein DOTSEDRAFT_75572 [Dothistroma septosporum NZE10]
MGGRPLGATGCYTRFTSTAERIAFARSEPYQRDWYIVPKQRKQNRRNAHMQSMREIRRIKLTEKKRGIARELVTPAAAMNTKSSGRRIETIRNRREEDHDSAYSSYDNSSSLINETSSSTNAAVDRTRGILDSGDMTSAPEIGLKDHTITSSSLSTDLA